MRDPIKLFIVAASLALAPAMSGCVVVSDTVAVGDPIDAHFSLTWVTADAVSGDVLECHSIGADSVRVTATNLDTGDAFVDLFDCGALKGSTDAVTAGDYSVSVDLVRCGSDPTCLSVPVFAGTDLPETFSVFTAGELDLGHFEFNVN